MKRKTILPLLLCITLAASMLAACGGTTNGDADAPGATSTPTPAAGGADTPADETPTPTPPDDNSGTGDDGDSGGGENGGGSDGDTPSGGGVEELLKGILEGVGENETYQLPALMYTKLANDMEYGENGVAYFIGTHDVPFSDGAVAEAAIGAIPFSVALIQAEPGTDIENAKKLMEDGIDPAKWICVRADVVIVDNKDNYIILILSSEEHSPGLGEAIHTAFLQM